MASTTPTRRTFADYGIDLPSGASGEVKVICPQCGGPKRSKRENQRDRDLSVNVTEGVWQCWHCDWRGTLKSGGDGEVPYGAPLNREPRAKPAYQAPRKLEMPQTNVVDAMYAWFERERGISRAVVERNRITPVLTDRGWAMAFPHFRNGEHIGTQYRTKDKQIWQEKGAERIFYGLDDITPDTTDVIICEGQIDKLAFEMAGFRNCLSVPDGAPNANATNLTAKLTYLESTVDLFARMQRVYLACDNDANGQALNQELARRIGREKCWIVEWREGIKDANDALLLIGTPEITESIEIAKPFPIEGVIYAGDLEDGVSDLYYSGYDRGLTVGLSNLDDHYRVRPGLMSIVTGYSSHGKSLWLDHILCRLATRHGWRFALYSPENQPAKRHYANLLEIHVQRPFDQGFTSRMTADQMRDAMPFMREHFVWIEPEEPSIDTILDTTRQLVLQYGINGLVIDPWNELEHAQPRHQTETQYISESLGTLRRFARINDIHIWILAHPTKPMAGNTSQPPGMWQIAGSNHFWNKADYGLSIWRDPTDPSLAAQCKVEKVRFRETGRPGLVSFRYNGATRQIEEVA